MEIFATINHLKRSLIIVTDIWLDTAISELMISATRWSSSCISILIAYILLVEIIEHLTQTTSLSDGFHLSVLLPSIWVIWKCTGCRQQVCLTVATWSVLLTSYWLQTCQWRGIGTSDPSYWQKISGRLTVLAMYRYDEWRKLQVSNYSKESKT